MLRSLFHTIYSFGVRVANIGITSELTFHEKKKTQLLNIVVASGTPLNFFFAILNFWQRNTLLAITNVLLLAGGILILIINSYRRFLLSRLILTFLGSLLFMVGAIFFRNGAEYYLLTNLLVIIIYFNEKTYIILISSFNCLLFIGVRIFLHDSSYIYGTVSFNRVIFNISWALLTMVLALLFFKKEQKDYQDQVEEKNKELEKLNDTKEKLFSIIAHDLRSPIGQLRNSLDLVNREYMSPEAFKQVSSRLSSEVDHLHSTLDNLLRWSLNQFQGIKTTPEKVSLDELVEQKAMLFRRSFETKNISFEYQPSGLFVFADRDHLMLVLRNLVSNSIKYSHQNGSVSFLAYPKDDRVIIEISDTGIGMSEEIKTSLFNTTHLVSVTGTSNEKGTGLGLKLCKEFVEKNNGSIWLETEQEKGSTFYISMPAG
ncbi:MAG: HAMP domain-containing sensor histidine kinase [Bacteroidota bacterium]